MENITISIRGKNAGVQASAIVRAFYKTMARMEDGGCHVQLATSHIDEGAATTGEISVPDFISEQEGDNMAGKRIPKHKVTIRTLWGIAKSPELQLGSEELHLVVQAQTGKDSLKELTEPERRRVAYVLGQMKESASGKRKRPVGMTGNATDNQRRKIYMLTKELGWDDNPKRLSGFIRRMFRVERVEWLNYEQCSNLIEALKKMIERQEAAGGE